MSRSSRAVALVALVAALVAVCSAFGRSPAITNLPGYGATKETSFAGYLPIDAAGSTDAALFYWMFRSRSNPATDRTILMRPKPYWTPRIFELKFMGSFPPSIAPDHLRVLLFNCLP